MRRWNPPWEIKQAFKAGLAVVQHKKKGRQGTVGPCTSAADECYAVVQGDLEGFDGRRWGPMPARSLAWFPRDRRYGIRARLGYAGPVRIVSILFKAPPGFGSGLPRGPVRLPAPWWRRFLELEASCDYDERGQRTLAVADLAAFIERLARALAPGRARTLRRSTKPSAAKLAAAEPSRPDTEAEWLEAWTRAEDVIRDRAGQGLTVDELAEAVQVSPTQLRRVFHASRGQSPKAALTAWRIDEAKRLLAQGRLNVTQVGEAVGFGSLPRFSAAFKAATGRSPSAFARSRG
ncbi:MAG: helix-turn-helix transcriptional regulator [Planctomycetota bacterium]|nr:helix-turn-helix transcriptional regulator [Planctomycetota bacterium]